MMRKVFLTFATIFFLASGISLAQNATLTVIHGIPGNSVGLSDTTSLPVDVYVNGDLAFTFDFSESVENIELAAGDYLFEVYPGGADPAGSDPVLSAEAALVEDGNYTAVAHLTFTEDPAAPGINLSLFENNLSEMEPFRGRVTVRHTANAPEVSVKVRRFFLLPVTLPGFSNANGESPSSVTLDLVRGSHQINLLYQGDTVFTIAPLVVRQHQNVAAYAIGDFFNGSFEIVTQVIAE